MVYLRQFLDRIRKDKGTRYNHLTEASSTDDSNRSAENDKKPDVRHKVFLIYVPDDVVPAKRLELILRGMLYEVWYEDGSARPWKDIDEESRAALKTCEAAIVLCSEESNQSSKVSEQIKILIQRERNNGNVVMIPILISTSKNPKQLETRGNIDMRGTSFLRGLTRLLESLEEHFLSGTV